MTQPPKFISPTPPISPAGAARIVHDATGQMANSAEILLGQKPASRKGCKKSSRPHATFHRYFADLERTRSGGGAVKFWRKRSLALNAQPLGGGATKLYAPYLPWGPGTARLTLVNPTAQGRHLTLRLVNTNGRARERARHLTLGAGPQPTNATSASYSSSPVAVRLFHTRGRKQRSGAAGNVTLFNPSAPFLSGATFPLEARTASRLVFAHFNISDGFFTELGIFNPSALPARHARRLQTGRHAGAKPPQRARRHCLWRLPGQPVGAARDRPQGSSR